MKETGSGYDFSWHDLGDLQLGRPNLGLMVPVQVYRLLEYTFRDVLTKELGAPKTAELFERAGHLAGRQFCAHVLDVRLPWPDFIAQLQNTMVALQIGILRIEAADFDNLRFTLTVSEDLDCSGLPLYGETVCDYDEGFIAGILQTYTGQPFTVTEVDCWATGDRTCRFLAQKQEGPEGA